MMTVPMAGGAGEAEIISAVGVYIHEQSLAQTTPQPFNSPVDCVKECSMNAPSNGSSGSSP